MKMTITDQHDLFIAHLEWKGDEILEQYANLDREKNFDEWALMHFIQRSVQEARKSGSWNTSFEVIGRKITLNPIAKVPKFTNPLGFWLENQSYIEDSFKGKIKLSKPLPSPPPIEELLTPFEPDPSTFY